MAASLVIAPRYSAEDFETGSIRSAAPSYVSEVPSYRSSEPVPPYTPRERRNVNPQHGQQQTIGLPPIPAAPPANVPNLHNFRIPNWSTRGAPAARQLHSVVERRVNAERSSSTSSSSSSSSSQASSSTGSGAARPALAAAGDDQYVIRPLEDPYLVGEEAAAKARRERLARENDDVLQREDQQWDWLLAQMRTWDERERSWSRYRRSVETGQRKNLLRRIGGRMI